MSEGGQKVTYSGKTIAISIIPRREKRELLKLGTRNIFGWTAVQTHNANVARQVHNMSKEPRLPGPDVQPCLVLSDILRGTKLALPAYTNYLSDRRSRAVVNLMKRFRIVFSRGHTSRDLDSQKRSLFFALLRLHLLKAVIELEFDHVAFS